MRMILWFFFSCLVLHAGEAQQIPEHFKPFEAFVGPTWVAELPGDATDTQVFTWVYGGKFLRNVHYVKQAGKVVYGGETMFAWDPKAGSLVWWYWNDTGGYLTGTITFENGSFQVEGVNHDPANPVQKVRSHLIPGQDTWKSVQFHWSDGQWARAFEMDYAPAKK